LYRSNFVRRAGAAGERGACPSKIVRFGETADDIHFGAAMRIAMRADRAGQRRPQAAAKRLR